MLPYHPRQNVALTLHREVTNLLSVSPNPNRVQACEVRDGVLSYTRPGASTRLGHRGKWTNQWENTCSHKPLCLVSSAKEGMEGNKLSRGAGVSRATGDRVGDLRPGSSVLGMGWYGSFSSSPPWSGHHWPAWHWLTEKWQGISLSIVIFS